MAFLGLGAGAPLDYVYLIPLLPMLGALATLLFGDKAPQKGAAFVLVGVLGSFVLAAWTFMAVLQGNTWEHNWAWITLGSHEIRMGFLVDHLSAFMALLVTFLSTLIVIYSWGYMSHEGDGRRRYYAAVGLFVGGMLGTVLADNFLLMFMSWEIMGLCSYLLIGFWFKKPSAAAASLKAFLVTRVGDVMLFIGMIILFVTYGTFNYRELFAILADPGMREGVPLFFAGLMIFGGAVGKSAQFPLHDWLPDAMEGPTTVSALIHAATMVKAGVFLVARSFPIFIHTPDLFITIGVIGGFTAFFAATMALVLYDIKRILAYSTLSQLGYMFLGLGAGGWLLATTGNPLGYVAALFHLMNHAFFKALLFLGAGSVGHAFHDAKNPYDFRQMGGLHNKMKITSTTMLIGSLSIAGIPPLAGFWSKDEVLNAANLAGANAQLIYVMWILGVLTALMTAFYMFRMWFSTFAGQPRSELVAHAHESPKTMTAPLQVLSIFALLAGFIFFLPFGDSGGLEPYLAHDLVAYMPAGVVEHHEFHALEFVMHLFSNPLTYLSIAVAVIGLLVARNWYQRPSETPAKLKKNFSGLHAAATNRWGSSVVTEGIGGIAVGLVATIAAIFDKFVIDGLVNGIANVGKWGSDEVRSWQTGQVTTYALVTIVGITVLLIGSLYGEQIIALLQDNVFSRFTATSQGGA